MALFGTDGVRGLANGPLTADLALTLAQATAVVLGQGRIANARKAAGRRLTAVVARDPRISGHFLTAAVNAGLGLHRAMADHGISVETTGVNDRYALERMNAGRYSLGGEQSGHVIMSEFATTGDGLLTGLHLAAEMVRTGKSLAELASVMTVFPQLLINVRGVARSRAQDADVVAAVDAASAELGDSGRVLLRPSGTEELVRVMVEASTSDVASAVAERLAGVVRGE